jgi:hypothetical protein
MAPLITVAQPPGDASDIAHLAGNVRATAQVSSPEARSVAFVLPIGSEDQTQHPEHDQQADDEDDQQNPTDDFHGAVLSRVPPARRLCARLCKRLYPRRETAPER